MIKQYHYGKYNIKVVSYYREWAYRNIIYFAAVTLAYAAKNDDESGPYFGIH